MALRLLLQVNDIFYVDELKMQITSADYVGKSSVIATLDIYQTNKTETIALKVGDNNEVISQVFIELSPKGSVSQEKLQLLITAPKEIKIRREGYTF